MISMHDPNWEFYVPKQQLENVPLKGSKVGLQRFNGHLLPQLCRNLTVIKDMDVRPDDTFVVTFPKSGSIMMTKNLISPFLNRLLTGTNWVAEMCWLINNNCDFDAANKKHHMARSSFIDMGWSNGFLNLMPSPRVFQSHLRLEFLPDNVQNKAKVTPILTFKPIKRTCMDLLSLSMLCETQKTFWCRCISLAKNCLRIALMVLWRTCTKASWRAK